MCFRPLLVKEHEAVKAGESSGNAAFVHTDLLGAAQISRIRVDKFLCSVAESVANNKLDSCFLFCTKKNPSAHLR